MLFRNSDEIDIGGFGLSNCVEIERFDYERMSKPGDIA